ncbi:MAG: acylphosphatase [Thermodesulfobacteriota bacterium]
MTATGEHGEIRRVRAIVTGRVQGVFFRDSTRSRGEELGLKGWVRNLVDGSVETEFEGGNQAVEQMIDWLSEGPPCSRVVGVTLSELKTGGSTNGFEVLY